MTRYDYALHKVTTSYIFLLSCEDTGMGVWFLSGNSSVTRGEQRVRKEELGGRQRDSPPVTHSSTHRVGVVGYRNRARDKDTHSWLGYTYRWTSNSCIYWEPRSRSSVSPRNGPLHLPPSLRGPSVGRTRDVGFRPSTLPRDSTSKWYGLNSPKKWIGSETDKSHRCVGTGSVRSWTYSKSSVPRLSLSYRFLDSYTH